MEVQAPSLKMGSAKGLDFLRTENLYETSNNVDAMKY